MQQKKFRFTFSSDIKNALEDFARANVSADRKTIKHNWEDWTRANTAQIEEERERLVKEGCEDSWDEFVGKLYFSLRYYHIKRLRGAPSANAKGKGKGNQKGNEKGKGNGAVKYRFSSLLLKVILSHVNAILSKGGDILSPIDSYMDFISVHKKNILEEMVLYKQFQNGRFISKEECAGFMDKIKKTYQNKYYVLRHSSVGTARFVVDGDDGDDDDDDDFALETNLDTLGGSLLVS